MGITLIFPCCVPDGELYAEAARQRGEPVIGASSLAFDQSAAKFDSWFRLPSVYDLDFVERLNEAVTKRNIARIYCPVNSAYVVLSRLVADGTISVPIIGDAPILRFAQSHQNLMVEANGSYGLIQQIADGRSPLSPIEVASILRISLAIFGESDKAKIAALMAIFRDTPPGDVVEIGVLAGRSAAALTLAAARHNTGAVLAIDTWSDTARIQYDSPKDIQAKVQGWDPLIAFESFIVSMMPIAQENCFNYLAMPSKQAHSVWSQERRVDTPEFGEVRYSGKISVLHIDGNHDYACVSEDCAIWLPHLMPGGWLVLDDYFWLHGDGPRRVGDALLMAGTRDIERAFCCGKALFVKCGGKDANTQV